jgi:hypothetical protein
LVALVVTDHLWVGEVRHAVAAHAVRECQRRIT